MLLKWIYLISRIVVCSECTPKMLRLREIGNQKGHFMIISINDIVHTYTCTHINGEKTMPFK